jgi:hypothetical protein
VEQEHDPSRLKALSLRQLLRVARLPCPVAQRAAFEALLVAPGPACDSSADRR